MEPVNGVTIQFTGITQSGIDTTISIMTDDNGDIIYEVTIDLERNSFYWYKFRIGLTDGSWQGNWEGISDCGYGDYNDRYFSTTNMSNQTVGPYCFGSCENCEIPNMSLSFDGADDYVDCGNSESYNFNYFTAEAWINVAGTSNSNQLIISRWADSNTEQFALEIWRAGNYRKVGFGITVDRLTKHG